MTDAQSTNLTAIRAQLEGRQRELRQRLSHVEEELHSSHSQDFAEQATEREQDEVLVGEEAVFEQELEQIGAAIARIDNGSYSECRKCGEDISAERLAVQPEAPLCIKCAR